MSKIKKVATWGVSILLIAALTAMFGDFGLVAALCLIYFIFL